MYSKHSYSLFLKVTCIMGRDFLSSFWYLGNNLGEKFNSGKDGWFWPFSSPLSHPISQTKPQNCLAVDFWIQFLNTKGWLVWYKLRQPRYLARSSQNDWPPKTDDSTIQAGPVPGHPPRLTKKPEKMNKKPWEMDLFCFQEEIFWNFWRSLRKTLDLIFFLSYVPSKCSKVILFSTGDLSSTKPPVFFANRS